MGAHLTLIRNKILETINNRMDEVESQRQSFEADLLLVADFIENGANDSTIDWDGSFETELSQLFVNH